MGATKTTVQGKKSNFKLLLTTKRVEVDSGLKKYEFIEKASHFDENECSNSKEKSSMTGSIKRGPQGIIEGHKEKRQKIDRKTSLLCTAILKSLTSHRHGWAFNKPVDPVALNIPDYFTVISHPMDLGTIKSKLEKNIYFSIEEFAADVRLTFSNAMTYNPPMNAVHLMATELKKIFERKWKDLEKKCKCENENEKNLTGAVRGHVRKFCNRMRPLQKDTLPKKMQVPEMKEIQKISSLDGRHAKVEVPKSLQTRCKLIQKNLHKVCEGAASCLDSEHGCYTSHLTSPVTDSLSREEWSTPVYDVLLSPKQAIRVATLKRRFADTIRKAQNETLLDQHYSPTPFAFLCLGCENEDAKGKGKEAA
ncbi:transcription factor GTE12-like [Gastrolobium bilobum]|uniref:transcription factor GTE12-like n=1 Tax=Gastrolobium bilobum TaxID=150636 RepID=UPI002AB18CE5|nr:transcription factor GTE12-like [Gastrolobium bilobum]